MPGRLGAGNALSDRTLAATGSTLVMMLPGIGLPTRIWFPAFALPAGQLKRVSVAGSNNWPRSKFRLAGPPVPQRLAFCSVKVLTRFPSESNCLLRSPESIAAVGTVFWRDKPWIWRNGSKLPKKKVLFLWMGPPTEKPNWLRRYSGRLVAYAFRAPNFALPSNSYTAAFIAFV